MALLDDLKKLAEERQAELQRQEQLKLEREARYRKVIIPAMKAIHAYLVELLNYVKLVGVAVPASYTIPGVGPFKTFHVDGHLLRVSSNDEPKWITLDFRANSEHPLAFPVQPRNKAEEVAQFLRDTKLQFVEQPIRGANRAIVGLRFEVEAKIRGQVRFDADRERGRIHLSSVNFEDFSSRQRSFPPEAIDAEWLDRLGKYLLKRESEWVDRSISDEEREAIRQAIRKQRRETEGF